MAFIQELRRRKVIRVAAAYLVAAWLLIQVAETVFPLFGFDDTPARFVVILRAIGFIRVLIVAWVYELTSEGIRRSAPARQAGAAEPGGKVVDYALLAGVLILVAATVVTQFRSEPDAATAVVPVEAADSQPSIAVLAFEDLSPDGDQAYFADGISEELLNELARLEGLDVASRISSFKFKGSNETAPAIGQQLGVNHVLEGSVRKDGDKLRITVQLIRVADGFHRWSENYDHQLSDVFKIQEDIARNVAGKLGVQFGLEGGSVYRGTGTTSIEAYDLYLGALAAKYQWDRIETLLERAVVLDPEYAQAWALRGGSAAGSLASLDNPEDGPEIRNQAQEYLQRAISLRSDLPDAHTWLGYVRYIGFDWIAAEQTLDRSLELQFDWLPLWLKGRMYLRAGRETAALSNTARLDVLAANYGDYQPSEFTPFFANLSLSNLDAARAVIRDFDHLLPDNWRLRLEFWIAVNEDDPNTLREAIKALPATYRGYAQLFAPVLAIWDDPERVRDTLRASLDNDTDANMWARKYDDIAMLAAYFDAPELALDAKSKEIDGMPWTFTLWFPVMADARRLSEFKQFVTDINLVAYWREYGWPDVCRQPDPDDFCE